MTKLENPGLPVVYGAPYSVYVRIVRLTQEEKSVEYELQDVDIFAESRSDNTITLRHPFLKIPTFAHNDFDLYETAAITRYIDETFPESPLTPDNITNRARMNQIISILDNYAYPSWVWGLYVELVSNPEEKLPTDKNRLDKAIDESARCLKAITDLRIDNGPYLMGSTFTLADIYAIPMYAYLTITDMGRDMVDQTWWSGWWETVQSRESVIKTQFPRENRNHQ